jgi:hypothetical protein
MYSTSMYVKSKLQLICCVLLAICFFYYLYRIEVNFCSIISCPSELYRFVKSSMASNHKMYNCFFLILGALQNFSPSLTLPTMSSIKDRLIADQSTCCFSMVLCGSCKKMKTHHQCLAPVSKGGMLHGMDDNRACAMPICGPCNDELGNENIFKCYFHSESKENLTQLPSQKDKVLPRQNRAVEYSSKELLILSQAYIKTSENSIEGASQKKISLG